MIDQKFFEITEQHLLLLQHSNVWYDDTTAYRGAAAIDVKRPYGNKTVLHDIGRILNIPPNECNEDGDRDYDKETEKELIKIHEQTATALQICLQLRAFETGVYHTCGLFQSEWEKCDD